jgi:putative DNA primase/helicase
MKRDFPMSDDNIINLSAFQRQQQSGRRKLASPKIPTDVARDYFAQHCTHQDGNPTLQFWGGEWWRWRTSHWAVVDPRMMRADLYKYTENAVYLDAEGKEKRWAPSRNKISDLIEASGSICILPDAITMPRWLDRRIRCAKC